MPDSNLLTIPYRGITRHVAYPIAPPQVAKRYTLSLCVCVQFVALDGEHEEGQDGI